MIAISNNYFQDLNAAIADGLFLKNAKPKKAALYDAIAQHNALAVEPETVEPEDDAALVAALLEMDAAEDAAKAEQQAAKQADKQADKIMSRAQKNAADLHEYRQIVELKQAIGPSKAAQQISAMGRQMGTTTVCQIATTYHKVLMASDKIQALYHAGLVSWGELYARSRKINIQAIEQEFASRAS
jgi:hypothetical protein